MKGELSGVVGPVFAGRRSHRFGLRRQPGAAQRSQVLAKELVALEPDVILGQATPGTPRCRADAGRVRPFQ
jgi:hypothetical protein